MSVCFKLLVMLCAVTVDIRAVPQETASHYHSMDLAVVLTGAETSLVAYGERCETGK